MRNHKILLILGTIFTLLGGGGLIYDLFMWFWEIPSLTHSPTEIPPAAILAAYIGAILVGIVSLLFFVPGIIFLIKISKNSKEV